jgi:hypothetical protein
MWQLENQNQKQKTKPCTYFLALLKFLLAKSLKFSQKKEKRKKRADLIFVVM